jgi:hypothetical protein
MSIENNFIKHIVATKERINEWPEWKKTSWEVMIYLPSQLCFR